METIDSMLCMGQNIDSKIDEAGMVIPAFLYALIRFQLVEELIGAFCGFIFARKWLRRLGLLASANFTGLDRFREGSRYVCVQSGSEEALLGGDCDLSVSHLSGAGRGGEELRMSRGLPRAGS
jgi:hypothetical protein